MEDEITRMVGHDNRPKVSRSSEMGDFERGRDGYIRVKRGEEGRYARREDLEPNLLYAILEKLEEIRCGLIDLSPEVSREVDKLCKYCEVEDKLSLYWKCNTCPARSKVKTEERRESCPYCDGKGTLPVHWVCSNCGAKPRVTSKWCYRCGTQKGA